jgi:biotin operon repressor
MDTTEQVFETIKSAGQPVSAGQIAEKSGIDRKEVDKAMKKLKTSGRCPISLRSGRRLPADLHS